MRSGTVAPLAASMGLCNMQAAYEIYYCMLQNGLNDLYIPLSILLSTPLFSPDVSQKVLRHLAQDFGQGHYSRNKHHVQVNNTSCHADTKSITGYFELIEWHVPISRLFKQVK